MKRPRYVSRKILLGTKPIPSHEKSWFHFVVMLIDETWGYNTEASLLRVLIVRKRWTFGLNKKIKEDNLRNVRGGTSYSCGVF